MSDQSPSQAEGERDEDDEQGTGPDHSTPTGHPCPRQLPSQAEGERDDEE